IPQYIAAEKGWTGRIAVTQPRRVAAVSVARRVAEEVGCECGDEIGYAIRFEDITSDKTRVKYLTDGILLRELLTDRLLSDYSVVMLDEAHERSLHTDILFALMKEVVTARPDDFRLLVTSATLDVSKFSHYFFDAPTIDVPGRCFPVEIQHVDSNRYVDKAMELVDVLHSTEPTEHHILVFLTGEDEIVRCCQGVNQKIKRRQDDGEAVQGLRICMLHSSLPVEFYQRVFDEPPDGTRKLVVATNIAETSITVPGIKFVIDCGAVKQKIFNAESGMESLNIVPVSKQAAKQRAGRAGRTGPGICLRLYSQKRMDTEFPDETAPEILRTNLASTVLTLKGMGINDPLSFDYMDAPDTEKLVAALRMLYLLGALDADGHLSKLGRDMALFPLEPALSRMILASIHHDCADDMVTVVAMLAADGANVFYRPTMAEEKEMATAAKQRFYDPEGDYAGLLKLFNEWVAAGGVRGGLKWSKDNYVHSRAMCRAWDVRQQLLGIMGRFDMPITKAKRVQQVGRAIAESLYVNAARRGGKDCYETLAEGRMVAVSPSSLLAPFDKDDWAELVVCLEMVWTSNGQMRFVCAAKAKWVMDLLPKINTVDIKRLCGGNMKIKKKGADVGLADVRAAEAAKVEVKKDTGEVNDAKARYLERKKAREAAAK
ncbi:P-loop containing nucleoside triphosphate hydrolase protein, partial [Baffinella frigidus]